MMHVAPRRRLVAEADDRLPPGTDKRLKHAKQDAHGELDALSAGQGALHDRLQARDSLSVDFVEVKVDRLVVEGDIFGE